MEDNDEHFLKQYLTMEVTEFDIVMDDNDEHPEKQWFPMT
jgi:hypothetical protein